MNKIALGLFSCFISFSSYGSLSDMMKIYNNPGFAPQVKNCDYNGYCNGYVALAKQWNSIPDSYRYMGEYDIKAYAKDGRTFDDQGRNIGLHSGFYLHTERSIKFVEGLDSYKGKGGYLPEPYIERGLAVLLYIEDKNGWVPKD